MRLFGRTCGMVLALSTLAACVPLMPTVPTKRTSARPISAAASEMRGTVLGLDGRPAAGVLVRSYVIGNATANLIGNATGNLIGNATGNYALLQTGAETRTEADGGFRLPRVEGRHLNVEAVQNAGVKAIALEVAPGAAAVELRLAKTGVLRGRVTAPEAPGVTNLEGVDVFIPGTAYVAKTDADGSYTLPEVPAGIFTLVARKAGLGRAEAAGVSVRSEQTAEAPVLALAHVAPSIASVTPAAAGPGAEVTIVGEHFGVNEGLPLQVAFGGAIAANPVRVDARTLRVVVPGSAGTGEVTVTVDGATSEGAAFSVLKSIAIGQEPAEVLKGQSLALVAQGVDTTGQAVPDVPVSWEVVGEGAAVDGGRLVGQSPGKVVVRAVSGSLSTEQSIEVVTELYTVAPFAGAGQAGFADGAAAEARFKGPEDLAFDSRGQLYVLDRGNASLRVVAPDGSVSTLVDGRAGVPNDPSRQARFTGVVIDARDEIYLLDAGRRSIFRVTDGSFELLAGGANTVDILDGVGSGAGFGTLSRAVADASGNLIVPDVSGLSGKPVLRQVTSAGQVTTLPVSWPTEGQPALQFPLPLPGGGLSNIVDLAIDGSGSLLTLDVPLAMPLKGYLRKVTELQHVATLAGGGTSKPPADGEGAAASLGALTGIALDAHGNALITEVAGSGLDLSAPTLSFETTALVRRVSASGQVRTVARVTRKAAAAGQADGQLIEPAAIVAGPDGSFYVADARAHRVFVVRVQRAE